MRNAGDISRFGTIDQQPDPDFYVQFMDRANEIAGVLEIERRAIERLALAPGGRALDLGCGTGDDTRRLAAVVGPTGEAVGIDASETMIGVARKRSDETGLPATFHVGDATTVDYPDGAFDAVRAERLLLHMPEPVVVLTEMVRLTRPGGRVVVIDVDYDQLIIDLPDVELTRRVIHAMGDSMASGHIGRQLPRLFRTVGLTDIHCDSEMIVFPPDLVAPFIGGSLAAALSTGRLDPADGDAFGKSIEVAQADGELFAAFLSFVVSGTKA